ncbi:putative protein-serine/threonine phosphatase [Rosa chinensis]|uniref:Serine/threonine-protein phosphatase n=1 Tax=Rosa chinensis TaxID=74649 RepID=A0A2P6QTA7_ROSCH|nr:putative protein-serine/threonine phosphatase [Rosa chinensis]
MFYLSYLICMGVKFAHPLLHSTHPLHFFNISYQSTIFLFQNYPSLSLPPLPPSRFPSESESESDPSHCNPPLPTSQHQEQSLSPNQVPEVAEPAILGSSSPPPSELDFPIEWPPHGNLSLDWVLPVRVFDSLALCASKILHKEPNCVKIDDCGPNSTAVVGDVHSQLHDVLFLLKDAGYPSENRVFVFNGDYVDRGAWGLETFLILLAWKVLMLKSVYLLRGNHESKYCTSVYGFEKEVLVKYRDDDGKDKVGKHVYRKCLGCFERLPLTSIINGHVYTAHGGLAV